MGRLAAALGKPLQPWQQQVVDVALEILSDGSWAYRTVVVHVQRQAGKTTLIGPVALHRCLTRMRAKTWLTAQKRQAGRDTWRDVAQLVSSSPLGGALSVRRSNGSEELAAPSTGSTFRVFAPTEDALHGTANELVCVDEGWAFDGVEGHQLQQAILPTFSTTGGQLWMPSTAGTAASAWLLSYVERGRAAVAADRREGLAYFEWSLSPEDARTVTELLTELRREDSRRAGGVGWKEGDEDARAAMLGRVVDLTLAAHPGQYVRRDSLLSAAEDMAPGEYVRAYGNVWTMTADRTIPDHLWQSCGAKLDQPEAGDLVLSYDVALDRSTAAIGAAWALDDGRTAVDSIDSRPGAGWLVERIEQLATRWGVKRVWYDKSGPALDVADELNRRGIVEAVGLDSRDNAAACAGYLADVLATNLAHRNNPALNAAAAAAAQRDLGDGWTWSRRKSAAPIAPLNATTFARWGLTHEPTPTAAPVVVSRRRTERTQAHRAHMTRGAAPTSNA